MSVLKNRDPIGPDRIAGWLVLRFALFHLFCWQPQDDNRRFLCVISASLLALVMYVLIDAAHQPGHASISLQVYAWLGALSAFLALAIGGSLARRRYGGERS